LNNRNTNTNTNTNTNANTNNNLSNMGRVNIGGQSFFIDNYEEYFIPRTLRGSTNASTNTNANGVYSRILNNFFDPVPIYPTQTQIEHATRRVRYCDIVTPLNTSCPISLEAFNDSDNVTVIRHCGHIFNTSEINNWFRSNCVCPVCRYDIRNYNNNNIQSSNTQNSNTQSSNPISEDNTTETANPVNRNNSYNRENPSNIENINPDTNRIDSQHFVDLIYDLSGNFVSDGSDTSAILNIFYNLLQRRGYL